MCISLALYPKARSLYWSIFYSLLWNISNAPNSTNPSKRSLFYPIPPVLPTVAANPSTIWSANYPSHPNWCSNFWRNRWALCIPHQAYLIHRLWYHCIPHYTSGPVPEPLRFERSMIWIAILSGFHFTGRPLVVSLDRIMWCSKCWKLSTCTCRGREYNSKEFITRIASIEVFGKGEPCFCLLISFCISWQYTSLSSPAWKSM